jgi:hypothetical protein
MVYASRDAVNLDRQSALLRYVAFTFSSVVRSFIVNWSQICSRIGKTKVTDRNDSGRVLNASAHLLSRVLVGQSASESLCSSVKQTLFAVTNYMDQSPSWEAKSTLSWSRNSPHVMGLEGSSPYSQGPTACPYPEPNESNPHHQTHFPKIHLNVTLNHKHAI